MQTYVAMTHMLASESVLARATWFTRPITFRAFALCIYLH